MKCMNEKCENESLPRRKCCSDECMSEVRSKQASKRSKNHLWRSGFTNKEHLLGSDLEYRGTSWEMSAKI